MENIFKIVGPAIPQTIYMVLFSSIIASVNEIFKLIDEGKFIKLDYYKKFFSSVGQFTLREEE